MSHHELFMMSNDILKKRRAKFGRHFLRFYEIYVSSFLLITTLHLQCSRPGLVVMLHKIHSYRWRRFFRNGSGLYNLFDSWLSSQNSLANVTCLYVLQLYFCKCGHSCPENLRRILSLPFIIGDSLQLIFPKQVLILQ